MTNKDKEQDKRKIAFFKTCMEQFMLNKMQDLQDDKIIIESNINFKDIDPDNYYSFLVNNVRIDYARYIFRQIRELMDMYL